MAIVELTADQIELLSNQLKLKVKELEAQVEDSLKNTEPVTLDQQSVGRVSRMDAIQQQQMAVANHEQSMLLQKQVLAAIKRVESGEYGFCLQCGEPIGFARLEAQPFTPLCLNCQSAKERQ